MLGEKKGLEMVHMYAVKGVEKVEVHGLAVLLKRMREQAKKTISMVASSPMLFLSISAEHCSIHTFLLGADW